METADSGDGPSRSSGLLFPGRLPRPESIVSSRMTDMGSEEGGDPSQQRLPGTSHPRAADLGSRPDTARTAASSKAPRPAQVRRQSKTLGLPVKRGSIASTSNASIGRNPSLGNKTHVPSITSNAFLRPMSSQKLQAQRGGAARPPVATQPSPHINDLDDAVTDRGGSFIDANAAAYSTMPRHQRRASDGENKNETAVPLQGTPVTEHEAFDPITANTSPSRGHHANGSQSDSDQPLRRRSGERPRPRIDVDRSFRDLGNLPSPIKSSRSFRSSFLLPNRGDAGRASQNRSTEGAEKLTSNNSSPRLRPADSPSQPRSKPLRPSAHAKGRGRVHQYFDGNTIFCLGGRWQNTRHRLVNIATGLFVLVPCVLFYIFEAPWLWRNMSPAIPVTFAYLTYICISSFIHASVSDPGVSCVAHGRASTTGLPRPSSHRRALALTQTDPAS